GELRADRAPDRDNRVPVDCDVRMIFDHQPGVAKRSRTVERVVVFVERVAERLGVRHDPGTDRLEQRDLVIRAAKGQREPLWRGSAGRYRIRLSRVTTASPTNCE